MGCCGKQLINIVSGHAKYNLGKLLGFPEEKFPGYVRRVRICQQCSQATWLTVAEYSDFLSRNAVDVIRNISDLSVLAPLPIKRNRKKTKLFCSKCKCFVPAKAMVKSEICPENKWPLNGV